MRLFRQRKQDRVDRRAALSGVPILNPGASIEALDEGGVRVALIVLRGPGFFERLRPKRMERTYELDEFGQFVLQQVDGERSVLDILNAFEKRFSLSRREAELSVVAFFKMLMQRQIVSVAVAPPNSAAPKTLLLFLILSLATLFARPAMANETDEDSASAANALTEIRQLSRIGGVIAPGTAGNLALESHVAEAFKDSGFEHGDIVFTAPKFEPGTLTLDCGAKGTFTLDTMHPTLMRPGNFQQDSFETNLVYLDKGDMTGLALAKGIELDGALAVMDYKSSDKWADLLRFGIKGVIFIGDGSYVYQEAVTKVHNSEVAFPRFFIDGEVGQKLRDLCSGNSGLAVRATATPSRWRESRLRDLWVMIPGNDERMSEQVLVITAPLDANSVIPARATGAQRLVNLHILLKLLEGFRAQPPGCSVMLVAVNGHTQRYAGERALAWHLLAEEKDIESQRDRLAEDMRIARLFYTEYNRLKLKPVDESKKKDLHVLLEILWVLDTRQQERREAEEDVLTPSTGMESDSDSKGQHDPLVTLDEPPPEEQPLDLSAFDDAALQSALTRAREKVIEAYGSFFASRGRDPAELKAEKQEDIEIFDSLASLSDAELRARLEGVKHIFDDEKLFEIWRTKLDESTGRRIYVKSKLQDEFKALVNATSAEMMATSLSKDYMDAERQNRIDQLTALKTNSRKVLVLFNKMDIGVGRSRTYYRQIAVQDTQRRLLREARDKYVKQYKRWLSVLQTAVETDRDNGAVRTALGTRKVALVLALELDANGKRVGFSYAGQDTRPDSFRDFGVILAEIAAAMQPEDEPNPYVDSISSATDKEPNYFFTFPESGIAYAQDAQTTPALSLKTAFVGAGAVFGPEDTTDHLDADTVHSLQDWVRRFITIIAGQADALSPTVLKPVVKARGGKYYSWSTQIRTFAMAEYTGKPIPTEEIPGTLVAVYEQGRPPNVTPSLVDGDVINAFIGISDETGSLSFYGLSERRRLAPIGYQMNDNFTEVLHALDKGRIQSSKQINSNIQRSPRITLPMFECREFVIKDRSDPSLVSAQAINVNKYWPKLAEGQSDPVKYGVHGAACISPARSHVSWGPVGIYIRQPRKGAEPKSLMVITEQKRCLLGATEETPEGEGFVSQKEMGPDFFQRVSEDMEILNRSRDEDLKGVVNQLLEEFQAKGRRHNEAAQAARAEKNHIAFLRESYQALGNEVKAYNEMQQMTGDMFKSIVVYMALMVPFCFFLQKLLFAFKKLEHELAGFSILFVSTFVIFRLIHPAFRLAMNPEAIFIAFILGAIGCFTTWVLYGRFHGEMQVLMRGIGGIGESAGYATIGQTATLIGVQNMRRRRVRTTLTTATIILVVFTMLAFSSVSRKAKPTLINKSSGSPYTGILYHWPAGLPMDEDSYRVLKTMMSAKGDVRVRRSMTQKGGWRMEHGTELDRTIDIVAVSGLPANDIVLRNSMSLIAGSMFSDNNAEEVFLTLSAAEALGIGEDDVGTATVRFMGRDLTVQGLLHDQRYRVARDLNPNLPLMPLGPPPKQGGDRPKKEVTLEIAATNIEERMIDATAVAVVPVGLAEQFGAKPCTVSAIYSDKMDEHELGDELQSLLDATQAKFYIGSKTPFKITRDAAAPVKAGVYYVGSSYRTAIGGLAKLIIPLIIAGSIILNTMLGTVYERKSEIAVFNAIGLNPTHIFMFFLAEALVYSFIGAVGGYLIGQVLTVGIKSLGLIQDMNINFSSLIVVYAILFTMLLVLLSTIYPGYVATRLAVPSGKRKWSMPPNDGNEMNVVFPCIYRPKLAYGIMYYLYSFFEPLSEQSTGDIIAHFQEAEQDEDEDGRPVLKMTYHLALAPYDLGVTQHATFKASYDDVVKSYRLHMDVSRESGRDTNWITTNKPFLERMRKYLIRWRNIDLTRQNWYVSHAAELFPAETTDKEIAETTDKEIAETADKETDETADKETDETADKETDET